MSGKDNGRQRNRNPSSQNCKQLIWIACITSQADKDEDISSFTPAQLQVQHSSNTVEHPGTGELTIQDSVTTNGTADHLQEVEPELPVTELQNEYKPPAEPEQSQSPTSQSTETWQPQNRRPAVRIVYDVPGQPSFYPGVTTKMHMVSAAPNLPPM